MRITRCLLVVCALAGSGLTAVGPDASAAPVHPRLLFGPSDIPAIRASVTSGQRQLAWQLLQRKAEAYLNPAHPQ